MENPEWELAEYARIDNTEQGEACNLLSLLAGYIPYVSSDFAQALYKEITDQLKNYQENTEIIKETKTETLTEVRLEWKKENDR